jgi:hypothetical protein
MTKIKMVSVMALALWAGVAVAETDPIATDWLKDIQNGKDNRNQIKTLRVDGDAVIGGVVRSDIGTVSALTNGKTVTVERAVNLFSATTTFTNTLATPSDNFAEAWIHTSGAACSVLFTNSPTLTVPAGLTNVVTAAYSGVAMTAGDSMKVISVSNKWFATEFVNQ